MLLAAYDGGMGADPWLNQGAKVADDTGAVLRGWRLATGWTQADVAQALGTTQQHLSQMENGQRPVSLEQRRLMVTEYGITEPVPVALIAHPLADCATGSHVSTGPGPNVYSGRSDRQRPARAAQVTTSLARVC
jgi:transcriptional regulator with XRE-family HTH domain